MRDLYGQLIDGKAGRRGQIREGGDGDVCAARRAARRSSWWRSSPASSRSTQDGKATVAFDIPDYNGRLRLMAVAYDAQNVGWAEAGLVVRDPVIAEISAPRFLAPGDKSNLSLTLQNLDGAAGRYDVAFNVDRRRAARRGRERRASSWRRAATTHLRVALLGQRVGSGEITLSLKGPGGYALDRTIAIPVRPANTPVDRDADHAADAGRGDDAQPGGARSVPGRRASCARASARRRTSTCRPSCANLEHYPYGCLEQTTQRAYPLLMAGDVAELWQLEDRYKQVDKEQLNKAIQSTLNRQRFDGLFGLWSAFDSGEPWLSAFAMDFLMRAKAEGLRDPAIGHRPGHGGHAPDRQRAERRRQRRRPLWPRTVGAGLCALCAGARRPGQAGRPALCRRPAVVNARRRRLALAHIAAALAMNGEQQRASRAVR